MVGRGLHELGFQVTQLEYKLGWNGGRLIAVPAIHTSRTCPECGCTGPGNRKTQARF
jgi:putative transposase